MDAQRLASELDAVADERGTEMPKTGAPGESLFPGLEVGGCGEVEALDVAAEQQQVERHMVSVDEGDILARDFAEGGGGRLAGIRVVGRADAQTEFVQVAPHSGGTDGDGRRRHLLGEDERMIGAHHERRDGPRGAETNGPAWRPTAARRPENSSFRRLP